MIRKAGGPAHVGRICGVSSQAVGQWTVIPDNSVLVLAHGLEYTQTPHDLRRDLYPYIDDGLPEEMRRSRRKR